MKRFILTPRARQDINDIWDYIANDNIEAADRVLDALDNAMIKLAKNPGPFRPANAPEVPPGKLQPSHTPVGSLWEACWTPTELPWRRE